jgi:hypothetical protein
MTRILTASLCAGLAAMCMWSAPSTVDLNLTVKLTVCPGTEPVLPLAGSPCTTSLVKDAIVVVAPMSGTVITGRTDAADNYSVVVPPGTYIVAATAGSGMRFASDPRWVVIPNRPTVRLDVNAFVQLA